MMPYERLDAWRSCHTLVLLVYRITRGYPSDERFGLVTQMRRAAVSAASNIAEGTAKRGPKELRRYLDIALGSLSELSYQIRLSRDLHYLSPTEFNELDGERQLSGRLTWGLHQAIMRRDPVPH